MTTTLTQGTDSVEPNCLAALHATIMTRFCESISGAEVKLQAFFSKSEEEKQRSPL